MTSASIVCPIRLTQILPLRSKQPHFYFQRALEAPFRTMASNVGLSPDVVHLKVEDATGFEGINFANGDREDLKSAGVLDPAKGNSMRY